MCGRCGHVSTTKSNLLQHLRKKKECEPTLSSRNRDEYISDLLKKEYNEVTYACSFCEKQFNTFQSKYRHQKTCKQRVVQEKTESKDIACELATLREKVALLEEQLKSHCVNITNNTHNGNVNHVHVTYNNFGSESVNHLPKDFLNNLVITQDIPMLAENIYFDKDCPENNTVRMKSMKRKLVEIVKDGKWQTASMDNTTQDMINQCCRILKTHYNQHKNEIDEEMSDEEIQELAKWFMLIWHNDKKVNGKLREQLIILLDNYR